MLRINQMKAQKVADGTWKLDPHSALYIAMHRKTLTTVDYIINQSEEHRPDLVALNVYGDPSMWWVLAFYNGMILPLKETVTGRTLKVPMFNEVEDLFNKSNVRNSRTGEVVEV